MNHYKQSVVLEYVEFIFKLLLLDHQDVSKEVLNGNKIDQIISARILEDKNLSEMVHKFIIHSHEIACNRDSPVCIKHFPKPGSNRTYINSCGFPVYKRHTEQDHYEEAAIFRGLLVSDNELMLCFHQAIIEALYIPRQLRGLFTILTIENGSAAQIYELYNKEMQQDFIEQATLSLFGLPYVPMIHNLELETDVGEYRSFFEA
ncbi:hypothetical protein BB560_004753 [Smittium megazygosporum]|uniref:Uncharacterized protein n=1 Tax=Smittium megazygosporum TaxID=133381 RepID=A0A2T9Z8E7_9FUNG|nr:hypothetical protein BB560_005113 [Smittium megazygosporum]PVV00850.1 hypothetical protein BB560_004753 [Smittium megazygosporum]